MATTFRPLVTQRIVRVPRFVTDLWVQNLLATTLKPPTPTTRVPTLVSIAWRSGAVARGAQPSLNLLGTTLGGAVPFVQNDWPNPRVAWRAGPGLPEYFSPAAVDLVPRTPMRVTLVWLSGAVARAAQPGLDLLGTTLAPPPPVTPPFAQDDWPIPVRSAWRPSLDRLGLGTPPPEAPPAGPPFAWSDWPNPLRLTWRLSPDCLGLGPPPPAPPAAVPFTGVEWPNPRAWAWRPSTRVTRPGGVPPPVVGPPPVVPIAWPNPSAVRLTWRPISVVGGLPPFRIPPPPPPFGQRHWPNPRGPHFSVELRSWLGILIYLGFGEPDSQITDWPNPRRPVWRETGWVDSQIPPPTPPSRPFGQALWPNPRGPRARFDWIATTMPPPPEQLAFGQATWPILPGRRLIETGWIQSQVPSRIVVGEGPPPNQAEWPNPRLRRAIQDWIHAQYPNLHVPFNQDDWPNPLRRPLELGWINAQMPPPPVVQPFGQISLPLRLNVREWRLLETGWIDSQIPPPPVQPFAQPDWPNPRDPAFPLDLRTWLWLLAHIPIPPPPGIPVVPEDWPNPHDLRALWHDWIQAGGAGVVSGIPPVILPPGPIPIPPEPVPEAQRRRYGLLYCRQHRIFYVEDDRFPPPCAKWGGHEPGFSGS